MSSRTAEKALALIVAFFMVLGIGMLAIKYTNWRSIIPLYPTITQSITQPAHQTEPVKPRPEQIIASYLRDFPAKSEIREKAVNILNEYLGKSGVVLQNTYRVSAGSYYRVKLLLHSDVIYELSVSVSGSCIGTCDIYLKLLDSNYRAALVITSRGLNYIMGRYSSLYVNFTLHPLKEEGIYYLELDNSYSNTTSKDVYITLRAHYPSYVFDDEYFKVFAIGHWVSMNIRYISDPLIEGEYIAPPNETLRVGTGDCDDYAVLLATLYRSVGLDAVVGLIDTDDDNKVDHATALVYFTGNTTEILNGISKWASVLGIEVEKISYFDADGGVYLIVDPPMSTYKNNPWSIYHTSYKLIKIIKP
jgi:hypothetical protein